MTATTNWSSFDVPALAAMLAEDHSLAWDQVMAWRTAYDLVSSESRRLGRARAELADAWPPEHSPAAATYIGYIDELAASMATTGDAAIANSNVLATVLRVLGEARGNIELLHAKWQEYVKQEQFSQVPHAQAAYPPPPDNWAARLNAQAHQYMAETDQTIFESTRRLMEPQVLSIGEVSEPGTIVRIPTGHVPRASDKVSWQLGG